MKIIAVMNQKGGVGKTMTAAAIAYILGEEYGKKVLIADTDQQGNISMLYRCFDPEGRGMPELLENHTAAGGTYETAELIRTTAYNSIDIIPANGYLMRTNAVLLLVENENQIVRFSAAMNEVKEKYDYCIADCGLLMDMAVTNVLAAADVVIEPVKAGGFEVQAVINMKEQLDTIKGINPGIKAKILLTMRQKNKTTEQLQQWLYNNPDFDTFDTYIRRSVVAEKSTIAQLPLPGFSKNCMASQDYRRLCRELLEEGGL